MCAILSNTSRILKSRNIEKDTKHGFAKIQLSAIDSLYKCKFLIAISQIMTNFQVIMPNIHEASCYYKNLIFLLDQVC